MPPPIEIIKPEGSRHFEITKVFPGTPDHIVQRALEIITWESPNLPICKYDTGRSLYTALDFDGATEREGVKFKGAGGIRKNPSGGIIVSPPLPQEQYGDVRQVHFKLGSEYELTTGYSQHRALLSGTADELLNEGNLFAKACEHGIGLEPIVCGNFAGETDFLGRQTGALATRMPIHYRDLGDIYEFNLIRFQDGPEVFAAMRNSTNALNLELAGKLHAALFQIMGAVKRVAIVEAGIVRHAGHRGNFIIDPLTLNPSRPEDTDAFITDLDSAKDINELDQAQRPYQVLRDVAHDLWRCVSKYCTLFQMQAEAINVFEDTKEGPIYKFLKGFFGKTISDERIQQESMRLANLLFKYLEKKSANIQEALDQAIESGTHTGSQFFTMQFYEFFPECIITCYNLLQEDDDVKDHGYQLSFIDEPDLRAKGLKGVESFFALVIDEISRAEKSDRVGQI